VGSIDGPHAILLSGIYREFQGQLWLAVLCGILGALLCGMSWKRKGVLLLALSCSLGGFVFLKLPTLSRDVMASSAGLSWTTYSSDRKLNWAEVEQVYRTDRVINGIPQKSIRLVCKDNQEVVFSHVLDGYDALVSAIETHVLPRVITRTREGIQRGERVQFGPISVDRRGLRVTSNRREKPVEHDLTWSDVKAVSVQRGALLIYPTATLRQTTCEFIPTCLASIPNYVALVQVLTEMYSTR
jgi:hypothetical protein